MQHSDDDANFINTIVFSDELTFMLNGSVNRHNCSYWSNKNSLWMIEGQNLLFWIGVLRYRFTGPIFNDRNSDSRRYLFMLRDEKCLNCKK